MSSKKTKIDLVESVFEKLGETEHAQMSKEQVKQVTDLLFLEIKESLMEGHPIELRGLGVFEFRYRKAKSNARNPKTGKKVEVEGHSVVAFRAGNEIKDAVWGTEFGL